MSSSLSGTSPISTYLSIVKNESAAVTANLKTDTTVQQTIKAFDNDVVDIKSPTDLLNPKNQAALTVVLGAYNMSAESNETGLLKQLLTQDPSVSGSLVKSLGNSDDLHFVQGMTGRVTISIDPGSSTAGSFSASGSAASTVSLNNLAWSTADSALTTASPATTWSFVLDDGSASASVAKALTTALQSTGTSADPVTASYSVDPTTGQIEGSAGAPAITTSQDGAGNTVYNIALATNASGQTVRSANIVAVAAPVSTTDAIDPPDANFLLVSAMKAAGFNATYDSAGGISVVNPVANGPLSLSPQSDTKYVGKLTQAITTDDNVVPLGAAGIGLTAGSVLTSGGSAIGTVKSVDAAGDVTLTGPSSLALAQGAEIDVAIGAGVTNVGVSVTASADASAGTTTLALGAGGQGMVAGQILTDGNAVIGVVKSVDQFGNVTLNAGLAQSVSAGDTISVIPTVSDSTTPALSVASNVSSIVSQYETNQFETQQDKLNPGMADALYFTRTMPSVTSINQLMSDPRLLDVVTTVLGISSNYGSLPFDQQQALITSKVNLQTLSNPSALQHYAEQFLALNGSNIPQGDPSANVALQLATIGSQSDSDSDNDTPGGGANLLSALYPSSSSSLGLFSALYPSSSSDDGLSGLFSAIYA